MLFRSTGCGSAAPRSAEGTWTGAEDTRLELAADGSVTGTDGCNHIGGTWKQDGDTVEFSGMISTLMACPNAEVWLIYPASATIEGDTMLVSTSDGAELGELHRS